MKTAEQLTQYIRANAIEHVKVGITDIHGVMRGKYMSVKKLMKALENGFGFCDVIAGVDIDDELVDGLHCTGWHSGYPDAHLTLLPETSRVIPLKPNLYFTGGVHGNRQGLCPRQILKIIHKAQQMGFKAHCALEFEFPVFNNSIAQHMRLFFLRQPRLLG